MLWSKFLNWHIYNWAFVIQASSSSSIGVLACMSPIHGISLPFFKNHLEKSQIDNIPLCDGVHFQGYVFGVCKKTIVHVNFLRNNNSKNATYLMTRTSTSNLILNEESSLIPTVVVFGLFPVLLLISMHCLWHRD